MVHGISISIYYGPYILHHIGKTLQEPGAGVSLARAHEHAMKKDVSLARALRTRHARGPSFHKKGGCFLRTNGALPSNACILRHYG